MWVVINYRNLTKLQTAGKIYTTIIPLWRSLQIFHKYQHLLYYYYYYSKSICFQRNCCMWYFDYQLSEQDKFSVKTKTIELNNNLCIFPQAFLIAFTSQFLPKLLYQGTVSPDGSLKGYTNYSLAWAPANSTSVPCRYVRVKIQNGIKYYKPWII